MSFSAHLFTAAATGGAHELEEGGGQGKVHTSPVLDALGHKHPEELHHLTHTRQVRGRGGGVAGLWPGTREEAVRVLDVVAWGLGTVSQINLTPERNHTHTHRQTHHQLAPRVKGGQGPKGQG